MTGIVGHHEEYQKERHVRAAYLRSAVTTAMVATIPIARPLTPKNHFILEASPLVATGAAAWLPHASHT